jgi:hypothetical protein
MTLRPMARYVPPADGNLSRYLDERVAAALDVKVILTPPCIFH